MGIEQKYAQSAVYFQEAAKYMSGGVSSNFRLGMKPFPLFFDHASGSRIVDIDGHEYIDYVLGMGPVILGHAHAEVDEAVARELRRGQLFAGQHALELDLARVVCSLIPCAEMVRFSLSGSEAVQGALRAARAFTGRNRIIKFEGHYHGWFDNMFVSVSPPASACGDRNLPNVVPDSLGQDPHAYVADIVLPWNDADVLRCTLEKNREIAAVIMEPIMCNTAVIPPQPGYLQRVRELCSEHDVVLIFDEVITGFRIGLNGAQSLLRVTPDLALFAKAMANGYPISCIAGRRDIMKLFSTKAVVHGGTFNGNIVSCAAALTTLDYLKVHAEEVYGRITHLGGKLIQGLRAIAREMECPLLVQGFPSVFHTTFADVDEITDYRSYQKCRLDTQSLFVEELLREGVRVTGRGTWFLSAAHAAVDVEQTLCAARSALGRCAARARTEQAKQRDQERSV